VQRRQVGVVDGVDARAGLQQRRRDRRVAFVRVVVQRRRAVLVNCVDARAGLQQRRRGRRVAPLHGGVQPLLQLFRSFHAVAATS
jgi:hypothetical protein